MTDLKIKVALTLKPQIEFSYNNEIFINYTKVGVGNKPVIFLHGFGLSLFSWEEVKPFINTSDYTLYLLDLKGFGFSYKGEMGTYSIDEQAKIIVAFIKELRLNDVCLIGHSYGGLIALYLLYLNNLVKLGIYFVKLILLDTPAFSNTTPFFLRALRNPILNFIGLNIFSPRANAIFTIRNTFYDIDKGLSKYLQMYEFFFKQPGAKRAMTLAARHIYPSDIEDLTNFYPSITIPTLLIWGKNDKLIPLQFGMDLQKVLGNAKLVTIDNCGHVPNEEKPIITAGYINEFLEKEE